MKSGERLELEVTEGMAAMAGEKAILKRQRGRIGRPSAEEAASLEERILSATWDLLLAKGAGELSVERIARAAAVSKKTIYTRFHNRSDLLMRLLQRKLELEEDGLHEDVHVDDFRAAFCSVGRRILTFLISSERQAIAAVLTELPDARHDAWTSTYAVGLRAIDALLAHPGAAIALAHTDLTTFRHAFLHCLIGRAENVLRAPETDQSTSEDWMKALAELFLRYGPV